MKSVEFFKFWDKKTECKILDLLRYEAKTEAEAFVKS